MTLPSGSRSAEALRLVGITSPLALRGLRTMLRVTPRSTTSRNAAVNSRASSVLMNRERDCSNTSSCRNPSRCDTASLAWRILPSRSETNTGSGALAMMISAASRLCGLLVAGCKTGSIIGCVLLLLIFASAFSGAKEIELNWTPLAVPAPAIPSPGGRCPPYALHPCGKIFGLLCQKIMRMLLISLIPPGLPV